LLVVLASSSAGFFPSLLGLPLAGPDDREEDKAAADGLVVWLWAR